MTGEAEEMTALLSPEARRRLHELVSHLAALLIQVGEVGDAEIARLGLNGDEAVEMGNALFALTRGMIDNEVEDLALTRTVN